MNIYVHYFSPALPPCYRPDLTARDTDPPPTSTLPTLFTNSPHSLRFSDDLSPTTLICAPPIMDLFGIHSNAQHFIWPTLVAYSSAVTILNQLLFEKRGGAPKSLAEAANFRDKTKYERSTNRTRGHSCTLHGSTFLKDIRKSVVPMYLKIY